MRLTPLFSRRAPADSAVTSHQMPIHFRVIPSRANTGDLLLLWLFALKTIAKRQQKIIFYPAFLPVAVCKRYHAAGPMRRFAPGKARSKRKTSGSMVPRQENSVAQLPAHDAFRYCAPVKGCPYRNPRLLFQPWSVWECVCGPLKPAPQRCHDVVRLNASCFPRIMPPRAMAPAIPNARSDAGDFALEISGAADTLRGWTLSPCRGRLPGRRLRSLRSAARESTIELSNPFGR